MGDGGLGGSDPVGGEMSGSGALGGSASGGALSGNDGGGRWSALVKGEVHFAFSLGLVHALHQSASGRPVVRQVDFDLGMA